jgi:predicted RNA-binding Zn ribbon-like protein
MHVASGHHEAEVRLTLESLTDLVNAVVDADSGRSSGVDVRALLIEHGFTRAPTASQTSVDRVEQRIRALVARVSSLPDTEVAGAVAWVNAELAQIRIEPLLIEHDGAPLHVHWTRAGTGFDDQVMADVLMALAQGLVEHGTERFGRCGAEDCDHLFYDATRNRSRRFCSDARCASRTHTANHRARQRQQV